MGSNPKFGMLLHLREIPYVSHWPPVKRTELLRVCGCVATLTLRDHFREVSRGRPGHRFREYYERSKRDRKSGAAKDRIFRIVAAVVMFAIGLVLVFIPGPAVLFFFLGGALLASESLFVARAMDWLEVRVRAVWRWCKKHWDRLPLAAKIALVAIGLAAGAAVLWLGWMWLRG